MNFNPPPATRNFPSSQEQTNRSSHTRRSAPPPYPPTTATEYPTHSTSQTTNPPSHLLPTHIHPHLLPHHQTSLPPSTLTHSPHPLPTPTSKLRALRSFVVKPPRAKTRAKTPAKTPAKPPAKIPVIRSRRTIPHQLIPILPVVRSLPRRVVTLKPVNPDLPVLRTPRIEPSPPRCDSAFSIKTDRKRFDSTTNIPLCDPQRSLWERSPVAPRPIAGAWVSSGRFGSPFVPFYDGA
jgi:hypothetical protein